MAIARRVLQRAWGLLPRQVRFDSTHSDSAPSPPRAARTPSERSRWLQQRLTEYQETLGPSHHRTIAARNNLAAAYMELDQRETATDHFEAALADARQYLGEHAAQTDVVTENLAYCYEDSRRLDDAAALWESLVQLRTATLGASAGDTVDARSRLAGVYRRLGRLDAAVAHAERAVDDVAGVDAERMEQLRIALARTYHAADRVDDGVRQLRMVLAGRRHRLGATHQETLSLQHRLGQWQREAGKPAEAAETLAGAYRAAQSAAHDPEVRLLTLRIRRDLARAYQAAGREGDLTSLR